MSGRLTAAPGAAFAAREAAPADVVRVLVCDDSAVVRMALERRLRGHAGIRVVGTAGNGQQAVDAVQAGGIDVVILDVQMPVLDGLEALPRILAADRTVRVLMSSSLTVDGAETSMEALRLGAADFIPKPSAQRAAEGDEQFTAELVAKVLGLGRQSMRGKRVAGVRPVEMPAGAAPVAPVPAAAPAALTLRAASRQAPAVLAIGSSTGGPAALMTLFRALGKQVQVPILLTQHMPPQFTTQLAGHISRLGGPTCTEAVHGETLRAGHIHLAPGNKHMLVQRQGMASTIVLTDDPPENFCRPAVDPMLRSVTAAYPGRVLVAMLTGMGSDGLLGSRQVVEDGGSVVAQDEASSVVWGMPGAVARAGLCHLVLPLNDIAPRLLQLLSRRPA